MIFYGKEKDGVMVKFPYTYHDLVAENPNTNFGSNYNFYELFPETEAYQQGYKVIEIQSGEEPAFNPAYQRLELGQPELVDGEWKVFFVPVNFSDEEREAVWQGVWINIRRERNNRLSACDWTQLADAPLADAEKSVWAEYRQALRDITKAVNPFEVIWPSEPGA